MKEENRPIIQYFLKYLQKHTFFCVRSAKRAFMESTFYREYEGRPIGMTLGSLMSTMSQTGYLKRKDKVSAYTYRITTRLKTGVKKFLTEGKLKGIKKNNRNLDHIDTDEYLYRDYKVPIMHFLQTQEKPTDHFKQLFEKVTIHSNNNNNNNIY